MKNDNQNDFDETEIPYVAWQNFLDVVYEQFHFKQIADWLERVLENLFGK